MFSYKEIEDSISTQRNVSYIFLAILIFFVIITAGYAFYQISLLYNDVKEMEDRSTQANNLIIKTAADIETTISLLSASTGKTVELEQAMCGFACGAHQQLPHFIPYPEACTDRFPDVICVVP